ncbi:MAG: tetratricopeptide repeat protein [Nannocystaceae bacterium]|nr:tetratricopeptide repeat protein [Nannocystaceae bacterium]
MPAARGRATLAVMRTLAIAVLSLAACGPMGPSARSLHVVEGELVHSRPPAPHAYESYLRARLALDATPPDPDAALSYLRRAQRSDPRDPHLWATRAEAEALKGDFEGARTSARRALALSPGYPPAQRVLATIDGGARSAEAP